ncbi:MAG: hypothetical protein ACYCXW_21635, partial [Solirubrobacteraceae bacterium]
MSATPSTCAHAPMQAVQTSGGTPQPLAYVPPPYRPDAAFKGDAGLLSQALSDEDLYLWAAKLAAPLTIPIEGEEIDLFELHDLLEMGGEYALQAIANDPVDPHYNHIW